MFLILTVLVLAFVFFRGLGGESSKTELQILSEFVNENYFKEKEVKYTQVTEYYIYGTHLNLKGNLKNEDRKTVENLDFFFADKDGNEIEYVLSFEQDDDTISYYLSEEINDGINLEELALGNYIPVMEITYSDYITENFLLENTTEYDSLEYYTITKNNSNTRIFIDGTGNNFVIQANESSLPEEVYDIVIDPGHGGKDGGAVSGNYTESELVIDYSLELKAQLESLGLKVKLTRDGSESSTKDTVYNSYDEDGRVDITCSSQAKYCLSLHLNSNSSDLNGGGVEIYAPGNADLSFASKIAESIVENGETEYSMMNTYKVKSGVYVRNFTQRDLEAMMSAASENGYDPYEIGEYTPYLFMIRETGGIITGAFADGRNTAYGTNKYMNSNRGVETYILELGYISETSDLENIIENRNGYLEGIVQAVKNQFEL